MSYDLNAITAPDAYSSAATIEDKPIDWILLDVANQAIYWQLKYKIGGVNGDWEATEHYMMPGSRMVSRRNIIGIRIRAAITAANLPAGAKQAVATISAVTDT